MVLKFKVIYYQTTFQDVQNKRIVMFETLGRKVDRDFRIKNSTNFVVRVPQMSKRKSSIDKIVENAAKTPNVRLVTDLDNFRTVSIAAGAFILFKRLQFDLIFKYLLER